MRYRYWQGLPPAWHRHANGQTLHVTEGRGLVQSRGGEIVVQSRGGEIVVIRPGDTVYTPPGEWHWHGAGPEHFMSHLAMSEALGQGQDGPETEWGSHLAEQDYHRPQDHPSV